eukprot:CAMPEP_0172725756 /NCGR_PEP_ID=MMETSP1074-20121228/89179_1 /TAXON_ID=2916 /ORGANISM="Ceratium fusus, Strain PA161109" /LENGTH=107 /DNA_ID=CAMNT_0013552611 /DNA_START=384 /DNA_END=704 /DNA_ORIENTATION=+
MPSFAPGLSLRMCTSMRRGCCSRGAPADANAVVAFLGATCVAFPRWTPRAAPGAAGGEPVASTASSWGIEGMIASPDFAFASSSQLQFAPMTLVGWLSEASSARQLE